MSLPKRPCPECALEVVITHYTRHVVAHARARTRPARTCAHLPCSKPLMRLPTEWASQYAVRRFCPDGPCAESARAVRNAERVARLELARLAALAARLDPKRRCPVCGGRFAKGSPLTVHTGCRNIRHEELNGHGNGRVEPVVEYAHAHYRTVADVPRLCRKQAGGDGLVCGGLLLPRGEGFGCMVCGRRYVVAELLSRADRLGLPMRGATA